MGQPRARSLAPLFLVFAVSNALLAYGGLPGWLQVLIGLGGIALPLAIARQRGPGLSQVLAQEGSKTSFPVWAWLLVLGLGLGLRCYQLTSFQDFPLYDEVENALWARRWLEQGSTGLFFGNLPPFYIWLLAGGFHFFGVSLTWSWALPALLSLLSLFLFSAVAKRLLPGRLSFFFTLFLALGSWPLLLGRFSHQAVLMVFWEAAALLFLVLLLQAPTATIQDRWALLLGVWVGLGFYTYFGWPLVALLLLLTLGWLGRRQGWAPFWKFLAAMALPLLPALADASRKGYLDYVSSLVAFHPGPASIGGWDPGTALDYFRAFFWARHTMDFAYTPQWGGFLDPVLGALFFLGLASLLREPAHPWSRWLGAAVGILFFPVLLAKNANWFHVASLMPLFLGVAVLGLGALLQGLPGKATKWVWPGLMVLSFLLGGTALIRTRDFIREHPASPDLVRTYRTLQDIAQTRGPGLIFSDLWLKPWPPFLGIATTPFNRLLRPGEPRAAWAAVVANANLRPFLKKRFPEGKAYWISKDDHAPDGGVMVFTLDVTADRMALLQKWTEASRALGSLMDRYAFISLQDDPDPAGMVARLEQAHPAFRGDPFLESVYGEADAYLRFHEALRSGLLRVEGGRIIPPPPGTLDPCVQALREAVQKGYPAAHLYYQLGAYLTMDGRRGEAREAFGKAEASAPDLTDAAGALAKLKDIPAP